MEPGVAGRVRSRARARRNRARSCPGRPCPAGRRAACPASGRRPAEPFIWVCGPCMDIHGFHRYLRGELSDFLLSNIDIDALSCRRISRPEGSLVLQEPSSGRFSRVAATLPSSPALPQGLHPLSSWFHYVRRLGGPPSAGAFPVTVTVSVGGDRSVGPACPPGQTASTVGPAQAPSRRVLLRCYDSEMRTGYARP